MSETYRTLLSYHRELEGARESILYRWFPGKINEFYKRNSARINSINEKILDLSKGYFEYDGDGKIVFEGEGETRMRVMLEGKTIEEYQSELNKLLDQPCQIIF